MEQLVLVAAALACPVGMGTMMWMMMRGDRGATTSQDPEVARLRSEIISGSIAG
ncbi:hypothetical protein H8Z60_14340 [Mycolicibacterium fortuitum]|mgnify:CR=1 FL=1|nr:hypothetical protein [Mycolicibacterium fortuitum]